MSRLPEQEALLAETLAGLGRGAVEAALTQYRRRRDRSGCRCRARPRRGRGRAAPARHRPGSPWSLPEQEALLAETLAGLGRGAVEAALTQYGPAGTPLLGQAGHRALEIEGGRRRLRADRLGGAEIGADVG
jgi:hypothetical protein